MKKTIVILTLIGITALTGIGCRTSGLSVRGFDEQGGTENSLKLAVARIDGPAASGAVARRLRQETGLVADLVELPASADEAAGDRERMIAAAREQGAEAVFLYSGKLDSVLVHSSISVSNIRSAGDYPAPGTKVMIEGKASGVLIDVRTGRTIVKINSELAKSTGYPTFIAESRNRNLHREMDDELLAKLADELVFEMKEL